MCGGNRTKNRRIKICIGGNFDVRFLSIRTSETEQRYHSFDLEVFAVIVAVKKLKMYLLGNSFKIITDCKSFVATMKSSEVSKVTRYAIDFQDFDSVAE